MLYVTTRISSGNSARALEKDNAANAAAINRTVFARRSRNTPDVLFTSSRLPHPPPCPFLFLQRLLLLCIVLPLPRHTPIRLRRPVVLGRERLRIFGRERPVDRPLELPLLVHVHNVVRLGLRPAVFVHRLFIL